MGRPLLGVVFLYFLPMLEFFFRLLGLLSQHALLSSHFNDVLSLL
jgi:hypothetical protein